MYLLDSGYDWDYLVEPQEKGNSFLRHARAKVLGGCSSHNSCIAFWTPKEDLDEWAAIGLRGLELGRLLAADRPAGDQRRPRRASRAQRAGQHPHRPARGPVRRRAAARPPPQAGLPTSRFNEGHTVTNGAGWFQINSSRRQHADVVLARLPAPDPRQRARTSRSAPDCWVKRVVLEDGRATGVEYLTPDLLTQATRPRAARGDPLRRGDRHAQAADAVRASGPASTCRSSGSRRVVDSPGVGANLDDHVEGIVQWDARQPMIRHSTQWWEIGLFSTSEEGLDRPDLMMHYGSVPFDMNTARWGYPTTENGFCLTPNVCRGRSRGTVRLRSPDYRDRARVDPRYFTDPEGHDERVMAYGIRLARKIVAQSAMAEWAGAELAPGPDAQSDDELIDYMHKTHNTVYHPACTAHMGPDSDPMAVVDPRLRVRGVERPAGRGRLDPAVPAGDQPVHHDDDDRREVRGHDQAGRARRRTRRDRGGHWP